MEVIPGDLLPRYGRLFFKNRTFLPVMELVFCLFIRGLLAICPKAEFVQNLGS